MIIEAIGDGLIAEENLVFIETAMYPQPREILYDATKEPNEHTYPKPQYMTTIDKHQLIAPTTYGRIESYGSSKKIFFNARIEDKYRTVVIGTRSKVIAKLLYQCIESGTDFTEEMLQKDYPELLI